MPAPMTTAGRPYLFRCFDCDQHGSGYNITGPAGTLTYDADGKLHAAGDLPPWAVATGYADQAVAVANSSPLGAEGDDAIWQWLEDHYRAMTERAEA